MERYKQSRNNCLLITDNLECVFEKMGFVKGVKHNLTTQYLIMSG